MNDGWVQETDPNTGKVFYVNHATQQTSWTLPVSLPLPAGWEEHRDEEGRTYFYHALTKKVSWQDPRLGASAPISSSPSSSSSNNSQVSAYPSIATASSFVQEPRFKLKPTTTAATTSSSTWTCSRCTLENQTENAQCQVCGAARLDSNRSVMSDEAMAAALQAELDGEFDFLPQSSLSSSSILATPSKSLVSEPFELQPDMIPDDNSPSCLKCGAAFGKVLNRRHHCRCCGILSCHNCSSKRAIVRLPLNKEEMNEREQRCCDWCFDHLNDGHAHCLYRYVVLASKEGYEQRALAIRGMADVMENLPQQLSSATDRAQALRDLEVLKFVGGVPKMCSFLSPGDSIASQSEACRLLVALASASCVPELDSLGLPKRQVANELCEGAALSIMSRILAVPTRAENAAMQIHVVRILYLLGDIPSLKSAVREAELVVPLCDALLSQDSQLQDWACMTLGRLLRGDKQMLEEVFANQGVHNLILLLSSTNPMIQEHAALALQEAMLLGGDKVKRAMQGFHGTPACVTLLRSGESHVISAGLRLLLLLPESECAQIRSKAVGALPALVSIMSNNGNTDNQVFALQVLKHIANASPQDRHAVAQSGGGLLPTAVELMKSSHSALVRREATNLVEALSSDADGATQIVQASGGVQNLVNTVLRSSPADSSSVDASSASNALSLLLLQGAEAQQAMLESGALDALLGAVIARGDGLQASRVVEATFSFVSDASLLPKLLASTSPVALMHRLVQLAVNMQLLLPPHTIEMLLLVMAMLCNAKPGDYQMEDEGEEGEAANLLQPSAQQCRNLLCANAGPNTLLLWIKTYTQGEPGVALAALRCLVASASAGNVDRLCAQGALEASVQCMKETLRFGNDLALPKCQVLLHGFAFFARLVQHCTLMTKSNTEAVVRAGLLLLNEGLGLAEPECMLTAVRALQVCSVQSHTWKTIAEYSLPRCLEMLLADKTRSGPGGRDPLSSTQILQLLMDVSAICRNLSRLEAYSNAILDGGGLLALVTLLNETELKCTVSGIATLSALASSSKRCASAVAQNATLALLHLQESNRNGNAPIALLSRLVESDAGNAALVAQAAGAQGLDILLRLVSFEESQEALTVLCHTSAASDEVWDHIIASADLPVAVLMLHSTSLRRVQAKACIAIAKLCLTNISLHSTNQLVLETALPIMVGFLTPVDVLGSDKAESPALEAAGALAQLCDASIKQGDEVSRLALAKRLQELQVLDSARHLLLRERRLGRSKSVSTANALHCARAMLELAGERDATKFWPEKSPGAEDLFSALVMTLDANLAKTSSGEYAYLAIDNVCWALASFPAGGEISNDALARLSRPLTVALDKSMNNAACRLSCLRAMARAIREPALGSGGGNLLGSVRSVTTALLGGMDQDQQVETALLLASLLRGAASQDRLVQDLVANSGALPLLFTLLDDPSQRAQVLSCLATMIEFGGNAIKRAMRGVCGEEEIAKLRSVIDDEEGESIKTREHALCLAARLASLDEKREDFALFRACCFHVLETSHEAGDAKRFLLRPAIELLAWLEYEGEEASALEQLLLRVVADEKQDSAARAEALNTLAFIAYAAGPRPDDTIIRFPPSALLQFKQQALFALLAMCGHAATGGGSGIESRIADFATHLLPNLVTLAREENESQTDQVAQILFQVSSTSQTLRAQIRAADLVKILKDKPGGLSRLFYAQRLLRLLGEEFQPLAAAAAAPGSLPTKTLSLVKTQQQQVAEKRKLDAPATTPPPPPKTLFPTFSGPQSAEEKSSLELAMRLQQLEQQGPPPPPPPPMPTSVLWNCAACTMENPASATVCAVCSSPKPNGNAAVAATSGVGGGTRVRCQSCMTESLVSPASAKFRCSNCGAMAQVRDCKI